MISTKHSNGHQRGLAVRERLFTTHRLGRRFHPLHMLALRTAPFALSCGNPPAVAYEHADQIRYVCEAYQANRDGFSHSRCVYRVRYGQARSYEAALAGTGEPEWSAETWPGVRPAILHGLLIVDGRRSLEREFSEAEMQVVSFDPKSGFGGATNTSEQWLHDGTYLLAHSPSFRAGSLYGPEEQAGLKRAPHQSPWAGAIFSDRDSSPYHHIVRALESKACRLLGPSNFRNRRVVVVATDDDRKWRYSFDPERSHLCVRIECLDASDETTVESVVTDVLKLPSGRHFPMRVVRVNRPAAPEGELRNFTVIETVEIDDNYRCAPDDLSIVVNQGSFVDSNLLDYASLKYDEDTRIYVTDLPELRERLLERGRAFQSLVGLDPGGADGGGSSGTAHRFGLTGPIRWIIFVGNALAIVAIIAFVYWRKRRSSHRAP